MFQLYANKNQLAVCQREPVTSGSINVYRARFEFSADWMGLERTAVFRCGGEFGSVLLSENGECVIPWEVLAISGRRLEAGVYGTRDGEVVLPTIWASLGVVLEGVSLSAETKPPTPKLWQQVLAGKGDRLDWTEDGELGLFSGEKLLSTVPAAGGGDHRSLTHRDAESQHPIEAIEGLMEALERIPRPMTAQELRKILMNGDVEYV